MRVYIIRGVVRHLVEGAQLEPWIEYTLLGLCIAACMVVPYLLGQLNFAIILSKRLFGVDVRDYGSGNGGATNMLRTFGKKAGIVTLLGDMGKAIISCLLGYLLIGRLGAFIAGLFCMLGHTMPIKYKFRGGKGVACAAAVILMTDLGNYTWVPFIFLALLLFFALITLGLRYVSLASVMCMLIYPLILYRCEMLLMDTLKTPTGEVLVNTEVGLYFIIALLMSLLVIFMHRENIKRLMKGQESKLDLSKKKKTLYNAEENADKKDEQYK